MNPELVHFFEEKGLKFVGHDTEGKRMEVIELGGKDCFLQCHIYKHSADTLSTEVSLNCISSASVQKRSRAILKSKD